MASIRQKELDIIFPEEKTQSEQTNMTCDPIHTMYVYQNTGEFFHFQSIKRPSLERLEHCQVKIYEKDPALELKLMIANAELKEAQEQIKQLQAELKKTNEENTILRQKAATNSISVLNRKGERVTARLCFLSPNPNASFNTTLLQPSNKRPRTK